MISTPSPPAQSECAPIAPLDELACSSELLLRGGLLRLPASVPYSNIERENPEFAGQLWKDIYVERDCRLNPVTLARLPAGATLVGGTDYCLRVNGRLLEDQYPPYTPRTPERIAEILGENTAPVVQAGSGLLVARFGIYTWGHWLGELLPKIVLTEARFPGRFKYVLPSNILVDHRPQFPWVKILQSVNAYGIDAERIVAVDVARTYVFEELHAVSSVWSDHMIHPDVSGLMISALRGPAPESSLRRLAIGRIDHYGRRLENKAEVERHLVGLGFEVVQIGELSFSEQVRLFSAAEVVFGVLGSDLTNIMYSPLGVKIITAAPSTFGDRFFYALAMSRRGVQADLRGPIVERDPETEHKSSFRLELAELEKAVDVLGLRADTNKAQIN